MSKNTRKFYADDGVSLLKTEEVTISSEPNDVNKVVKKTTNYKPDGKVDFVEESEEFYNSKTGEKIVPKKDQKNTNDITITAFIPYGGVSLRKYDMVDPTAGINHSFGQYLYAGFPSMFYPAKNF